jgi:chromosome segregation ATPase
MSDIDAILKELNEIDVKLDELPADAFNERITLRERHEELQAEAKQLAAAAHSDRPTADIEAELASLEQRLSDIKGERIDVVEQSGGGDAAGAGAEGLGAQGINWQIEASEGVPQIRERIGDLKGELRKRGVDPDKPGDWA